MQHVITSKRIFAIVSIFFLLISTRLFAEDEVKPSTTQVVPVAENWVAKVNGTPIGRKNFDNSLAAAKQQFATVSPAGKGPSQEKIKDEVLNRLIDVELMLQDSNRRMIAIDLSDLKNEFNNFKAEFDRDGKQTFEDFLEQNNISEEEFKWHMKRQFYMHELQKVLHKEFLASVKVEEKDIKEFYEKNKDNFKKEAQVRASHILIGIEKDADDKAKEEAKAKIEAIRTKVKSGEDFSELAQTNSSCPSKNQGGDLGFFTKKQMVEPFAEAAFSLEPGEISDVVETHFGYHIIKVAEKKAEETIAYEDVKVKIKEYLTQGQMDQAQTNYIQQLRKLAVIEKNPEL